MAVTPIKALLFLAGGCAAAGTIAYVSGALDPLFTSPPASDSCSARAARASRSQGRQAAGSRTASRRSAGKAGGSRNASDRCSGNGRAGGSRAELRHRSRRGRRFDRDRRQGHAERQGRAPHRLQRDRRGNGRPGRRFRRRAGGAAEARQLPDRAALDGAGQCRRHVGRDGGRVGPRNQGRPGSGAGRGTRQAVRDDHRSGARSSGRRRTASCRASGCRSTSRRTQARRTGRGGPAARARACASTAGPAAAGPHVVVEAVEIDGRKIFVAGAADPGRTVRGYANEILLGDAKASPDGRYPDRGRTRPAGRRLHHQGRCA